jgi:hypothetical protein
LVVFFFARELFGIRAAALPCDLRSGANYLAHGHIVHADIIAALALALFCYALLIVLETTDSERAICSDW